MSQPNPDTYPEYYQGYITNVHEHDLVEALRNSFKERKALLGKWPENRADYAYAEGKWTVKELMLHMMDTERVFVYRALRFTRADKTDLPGYDHNSYVPVSAAAHRSLKSVLKEMRAVRKASIHFFKNLNEEQLARTGTANGLEMSVQQLGFIISGHERHHLGVLVERYR